MRSTNACLALLTAAVASAPVHAQYLFCVESTNDRVVLLDANDGTVLNPVYIDLAPAGPATPIEAVVVNSQIWVTDQLNDKIMRFSLDGMTWLGNITGNLNNCRGAAFVNGTFYISNSEASGLTPAESIVMYDSAGTYLGSFLCDDPFDVLAFQGTLLVPGIDDDDIFRFGIFGSPLGAFHSSDGVTGINFPEQINLNNAGNVIAAGFTAPSGIYEYAAATGAQLNYYPGLGSIRGVEQLGNGLYVYTNASGIFSFDPMTATSTSLLGGVAGHFFSEVASLVPPTPVVFCVGDGSLVDHITQCPCGNNGAPGYGCANSFFSSGASLRASGVQANDDIVLHSEWTSFSAFTLMMQHANTGDTVFHDGVLCASNPLIRLRGRAAFGGEAFFPNSNFAQDSTTTLSQRGAVTVGSGARRYYAAWYRNASTSFCPPATANVTNGILIDW